MFVIKCKAKDLKKEIIRAYYEVKRNKKELL